MGDRGHESGRAHREAEAARRAMVARQDEALRREKEGYDKSPFEAWLARSFPRSRRSTTRSTPSPLDEGQESEGRLHPSPREELPSLRAQGTRPHHVALELSLPAPDRAPGLGHRRRKRRHREALEQDARDLAPSSPPSSARSSRATRWRWSRARAASMGELLLALPFDHVFFTGSPKVGARVGEAAQREHAGLTLELGGKSPTILLPGADLEDAAAKIMWGKCLNAGQTCIAPTTSSAPATCRSFAAGGRAAVKRMYGADEAARRASRTSRASWTSRPAAGTRPS